MLCKRCGHQNPKTNDKWLNVIFGAIIALVLGMLIFWSTTAEAEEVTNEVILCEKLEDAKALVDVSIDGTDEELIALLEEIFPSMRCVKRNMTYNKVIPKEYIEHYRKEGTGVTIVVLALLPNGINAYAIIHGTPRLKGKSI